MFPKKLVAILLALTLGWTTVACSSSQSISSEQNRNRNVASTPNYVSEGKYPVQQAQYNDANGEYTLMLLNTPSGKSPTFSTTNLQMARLTDEEIAAGDKTYLEVEGDRAVMHLTEDFKIEYVHNVTETQTNPETGRQETVVVRQQSSFWAPFAGALAGQALGSLLFTPQYYMPPVYQPGGVMTGYGSYGNTYNQAVDRYQTRYKEPPVAVTNRKTLRTTGTLRTPSTTSTKSRSSTSTRSTGSGFGSSKLRSSDKSRSNQMKRKPSFGSGFGSRRRSGFGGRRR